MSRITFNRNVASSSGVTADKFSTGAYKFGEIVVCNDINEPGVYILTLNGDGTSGPIAKINSSASVKIDGIDPSLATPVVSGDTLQQAVSKLQNQINNNSGSTSEVETKVGNIVVGVGLNPDGTYEAVIGTTYITGATSVQDALRLLDNAISQEVNDRKSAIESLDAEAETGDGLVFSKIIETDGLVTAETKALTLSTDATGLIYTLKLGDYVIGSINVPEDQFLSGVSFISAATVADVAEAAVAGQYIVLGQPYLKFIWRYGTGVTSPTFVDIAALSKTLAKDIKLSEEYTGTTFDIHSGTSVESAIEKLSNNLGVVSATSIAHLIKSSANTITTSVSTEGTYIDVNNDEDTIVRSDMVSTYGQLSVKLDIDSVVNDDATKSYMTEYTLKSKNGEYGKILDKRTFVEPANGDEGKWITSNHENKSIDGVVSDNWKIGLAVQEDIKSATGPGLDNNNGLATAYGVQLYVKSGLDGDDLWVGDDTPSYHFTTDRLIDNSSSIKYDTLHGALIKQETNNEEIDAAIGLVNNYSGEEGYRHQYPSASTLNTRFYSAATTVMGAIKLLDTNIGQTIDNLRGWSAITDGTGNKITANNNGDLLSFSGNTYVDIVASEDDKLQITTDVADTKASLTAATANNQLAGAYGVREWIESLDATVTGNEDGVKVSVNESDGKLIDLTVEVSTLDSDAAITTTANNVVSGKGVRNAINALDVDDNAVTNQYISQVSETDGKISVTRKQLFDSFTGGGITSTGNTLTQANHTLSIGGNSKEAGSSTCNIVNSISVDSLSNGAAGKLDITINVNGQTASKGLTGFNADKIDGYDAGNASGNVPISNGTVNTNFNADMVDGIHIVVGSTGTTANTIYFL